MLEIPKLLKPSEVARILRLSPAGMHFKIEKGEVPVIKLGAMKRIERSWIESLIGRSLTVEDFK